MSVNVTSVNFNAAKHHIVGFNRATIEVIDDYTIAGDADEAHIDLDAFSLLDVSSKTVTLASGLTFGKFARLARNSYLSARGTTFSGTALGQKYSAGGNSMIDTGTNNINLLPGDVVGTLTRNSQYFSGG